MPTIAEQFKETYESPKLVKEQYEFIDKGNISNHLKTKQVIKLTLDEMNKLSEDPDFWFYESDMNDYKNINTSSKYETSFDFSKQVDGYDISEYVGKCEKYLPSMHYLWWANHNNKDVMINVYDAYSLVDNNLNRRNEILRDKITGFHGSSDTINSPKLDITPYDDFNIKSNITYSKFLKNKCTDNVLASKFADPLTIISTNIPYSMYSLQPLPVNIYNWDIDKNVFTFGSYSLKKFESLLKDIMEYGISNPLFMRMEGQVLSSPDEETMLTVLAAKILKLPSIPVNIYFTKERAGINRLMDTLIKFNTPKPIYKNPSFMNSFLAPDIIVHSTNASSLELQRLNSIYPLTEYSGINRDEFITIRKFTGTKNKSTNTDPEIEKIVQENLKRAEENINKEISNKIDELNSEN